MQVCITLFLCELLKRYHWGIDLSMSPTTIGAPLVISEGSWICIVLFIARCWPYVPSTSPLFAHNLLSRLVCCSTKWWLWGPHQRKGTGHQLVWVEGKDEKALHWLGEKQSRVLQITPRPTYGQASLCWNSSWHILVQSNKGFFTL